MDYQCIRPFTGELWVPENGSWGELNGKLLNLSYGYGMVYVVHEVLDGQAGADLPFPLMFANRNIEVVSTLSKDLFAAGMFAWAGSQREDGGFYRIRWEPLFANPVGGQKASDTVQ